MQRFTERQLRVTTLKTINIPFAVKAKVKCFEVFTRASNQFIWLSFTGIPVARNMRIRINQVIFRCSGICEYGACPIILYDTLASQIARIFEGSFMFSDFQGENFSLLSFIPYELLLWKMLLKGYLMLRNIEGWVRSYVPEARSGRLYRVSKDRSERLLTFRVSQLSSCG